MNEDYLGTDIALNGTDLSLTYGDFALVSCKECVLQRIILLLYTEKGALFYDESFGSNLFYFVQDERNELILKNYKFEIEEILKKEPLVNNESIQVDVIYDKEEIRANVSFNILDYDTQYNLVITAGKEIKIWEE